ncbi:hypothetical protein VTK56DRAFT_6935 [Thermocarpiscus australiensis]
MSSISGIPREKRLELALEVIRSGQLSSIRAAASLYQVSHATLIRHLTRCNGQAPNRKLTLTEEQTLLQRIISLEERGLSPTLPFVQRIGNVLLQKRVPDASVKQLWVSRFMKRHEELKTRWSRNTTTAGLNVKTLTCLRPGLTGLMLRFSSSVSWQRISTTLMRPASR